MKKITFVTSNKGKVKEMEGLIKIPIEQVTIDLPEIQSLDLQEIIGYKAREAYKSIQKTVVVEDTSLIFHTLGRLPGPLIKWFLKELGTDGICNMMQHYENRTALAQNIFGLFDGDNMMFFSGEIKGSISNKPKGTNGFGWDAIFIPEGQLKTMAEMTDEEKLKVSFRSIAVKKLSEYLKSYNLRFS